MIPLEEARARINRDIVALPSIEVPIAEARDLVLTETVTAAENIPPFANTAMDGFAVRAADTSGASKESPRILPIAATIAAGQVAPRPLKGARRCGS